MPLPLTLNDSQSHLSYSDSKIRALQRSSCYLTPNSANFVYALNHVNRMRPPPLVDYAERSTSFTTLDRYCRRQFQIIVANCRHIGLA